jgi:hypothetical protein
MCQHTVFALLCGRQVRQRPAQVFGGFHHITSKFLHGVLPGIIHIALGTSQQVLVLRFGAQPLFLELRYGVFKLCNT